MNTATKIAEVQARVSALTFANNSLHQIREFNFRRGDHTDAARAELDAVLKLVNDRHVAARIELDELKAQLAAEEKAAKRAASDRRPQVKAAIMAAFKSDACKWSSLPLEAIIKAAALEACDVDEVRAALNQLVRDGSLAAFSEKRRATRFHDAVSVRFWELSRKTLVEIGLITE